MSAKRLQDEPTVDNPHQYQDGADSITADESAHTCSRCAFMYWNYYFRAVSIKPRFSFFKIKESERGLQSSFSTHIALPKAIFEIERQANTAASGTLLPK
jgi:hypothetical protein